jgi:hypothetical protein
VDRRGRREKVKFSKLHILHIILKPFNPSKLDVPLVRCRIGVMQFFVVQDHQWEKFEDTSYNKYVLTLLISGFTEF